MTGKAAKRQPEGGTAQMIILSELWSNTLDILREFRYCVSLKGNKAHERLHESPVPAVLPGAGVCGRAGGDRWTRREEAPPQHLLPLPGGVRGEADGHDPGSARGDGRGKGGRMKNTRRVRVCDMEETFFRAPSRKRSAPYLLRFAQR